MGEMTAVPAGRNRCEGEALAGVIRVDSEWLDDLPDVAADASEDGVIERKLGAIASLDFENESSTYVLEGHFAYELLADGKTLVVRKYSGSGMPIEGLDRGEIRYANRGEWTGELDASRKFEIAGELLWGDAFNDECALQVILRGTLLEDRRIAYLNSRISGMAASGEVAQTRVLVDVPALM